MDSKSVWALLDSRAGNDSQTIGLAESLSDHYENKIINYNRLSILPNLLLGKNLLHISNKEIIKPPFPDIVISTGRRLAIVALYIKYKNPNTKIIQIMNPEIYYDDFDLIIVPNHDNIDDKDNIIKTIGSIQKIKSVDLEESIGSFKYITENLPRPYISVLIGGSSKNSKFNIDDINQLIDNLLDYRDKTGGSFLITTSRRTSKIIKDIIQNRITTNRYIYNYESVNESNPYFAILSYANVIIVTGDSISMCSDACFTGKTVYIYSDKRFCSIKHLKFHDELCNSGFAIDFNDVSIDNQLNFKKLDEKKRIKNIIKSRFDI